MSGGYKLHYFNSRGMAEVIRLIFAELDIKYEDLRHSGDEWKQMKAARPYKFMPQLETPEGTTLVQSMAIARMLCTKHSMMPIGEQNVYQSEVVIEQCNDVMHTVPPIIFLLPAEEKGPATQKFYDEKAGGLFKPLCDIISKSSSGYVGGDKITVADFKLFSLIDFIKFYEVLAPVMTQFPALGTYYDAILKKHPKIANWVATRPKYGF